MAFFTDATMNRVLYFALYSNPTPEEDLAEELFDVRNEVLFEDFPEHTITRRMDPAHRAVYTALAKYVLDNFERKS